MKTLDHHRAIRALGERAIDYYRDTGCCVFCDADDVEGVPHEPHCDVGKLAGVEVTPERRELKQAQREMMTRFADGTLTRDEFEAYKARFGDGD